MLPTKIVCIGAGSDVFGLNTLATLMRSERLRGSRLALVDRDTGALDLVLRLAQRLNREWDAQMTVTAHSHHADALSDAAFVILAIEVPPREVLWRSDYEIPLKYGVRQPYAENGGPGGFAHAARNIGPVMEIVCDMESVCPDALLINFTNPMQRICDAVARYSSIRVVGLCHQIAFGYAMVGRVLHEDLGIDVSPTDGFWAPAGPAMERIDIQAAGLNHFTWMLQVHEKESGRDLYPLFAERWAEYDPSFQPLTRRIYRAFKLFPIPGDQHLSEYLPWVSDPLTEPWEKYGISLYEWDLRSSMRGQGRQKMALMASGEAAVDHLREVGSEGAAEVVESLAGAGHLYWPAVNLANMGYIPNLPQNAIVEVPGFFSGSGALGIGVGPLPEPIAELCRREISVVRLCVDAAVHGDRAAALQCLLLDPVITDLNVAQQVLDDYLETYRPYLPAFWD
jgi:alpha-galactosidase